MTFNRKTLTHIIIFFIALAGVLAAVSTPRAQEGGFFFMERPKLGIGASYELEEEKREVRDRETEATSHDWTETVTMATNGWVYHPNLMEFRFSVEPEWRQEKFEHWESMTVSTETDRRDTSILTYDANVGLLKRKPVSLDVFANRRNREIDLTNFQDSDYESETRGARLRFTNPTLPASIGFVNRKFDQTGFFDSEEDRDELQVRIRHNAPYSITELNLLYDEADRKTRSATAASDIESTARNTELTNTLFLTADERVRLDLLYYNIQAEYDETENDSWAVSENLFWQHSKNLLTQYRFNYNDREFDGFDSEEATLSAGLTHRLYDRLTTNIGSSAAFNNFVGGSEDHYRANVDFLYYRPIPWGSIELGAGYTYGETDRSGRENVIPAEEFPVLSVSEATFLGKQNILLESIVVTDFNGRIVYTENVDYRVEQIGPNVRIRRTLLGSITEGQQVMVRYRYLVDAGFDDSTFGQDYSFDLELWSLLYLTLTHGRFDQNVVSGDPLNEPIDDTYNTVRLRLDTQWTETEFLYEDQDRSNRNSTVTRSVRQLINIRPWRNFYFNFSGDYGRREFPDTDKDETFYTLGANLGWTPRWWCNFSVICLRSRIDGDRQDMLFSEIAPTLRLTYGVWTGTVSYRLTDQEDEESGDSLWRQRLYFVVERSLW